MGLHFRIEGGLCEPWDVHYMTLLEWLMWRFTKKWYVKNVEDANRKGKTYEPLLYEDTVVYDEKGVVRGCINQELPRWKMNYEIQENWKQ